jgi:hypothetical protein
MTKNKKLLTPEELEKRNAAFHKLSKRQQRIAIAKDVLSQLRLRKYKVKTGVYFRSDVLSNYFFEGGVYMASPKPPMDLQTCLLTKNPQCTVCALGSAFTSLSRLGDEVEFAQRERPHASLFPIFGEKQVHLIETAFEGLEVSWYKLSQKQLRKAYSFFKKYEPSANKRLAAIFRNIIRNEGTFKP